ncbi:MAG: hypothetical protein ACREF6_12265 [Alphaproteobacteria bacterium]
MAPPPDRTSPILGRVWGAACWAADSAENQNIKAKPMVIAENWNFI